MKTALRIYLLAVLASFALLTTTSAGMASGLQASGSQSTSTAGSVRKAPAKAPSAQEIADAKSKGLVWVNVSTHVYHKDTSSLYGTTKRGKFMTEDDAKKAGFRAANETGAMKKNAANAAGTQK